MGTKRAMDRLAWHGMNTGTPLYGTRVGEGGLLVPDEHEQKVLTFVKRLHGFKYSTRRIVKALADAGFVSRSGKPFRQTQVVRMLRK